MRLAILGGGTIAGLVLDAVARGALEKVEIVALAGRRADSPAAERARAHGVPYVVGAHALIGCGAEVVLEAASHAALAESLVAYLDAGLAVVVLSAGALCDDRLRSDAEAAASRGGGRLYVPSGGIGGLDALKGACEAGVDRVTIRVAKPPAAWRGIPYVEALGVDLGALAGPRTLFAGPARDGVPHFPQNVNIAAVLSLAGIGFDRTRLEVVADPGLVRNTHTITVEGVSGRFRMELENVPSPENPKTAWLASYSALAALRALATDAVRYGT